MIARDEERTTTLVELFAGGIIRPLIFWLIKPVKRANHGGRQVGASNVLEKECLNGIEFWFGERNRQAKKFTPSLALGEMPKHGNVSIA